MRAPQLEAAHLHAEEGARDVDELGSDDDNLLPGQRLLGDDGRQATEQVALAIDDDGRVAEGGHLLGANEVSERSSAEGEGGRMPPEWESNSRLTGALKLHWCQSERDWLEVDPGLFSRHPLDGRTTPWQSLIVRAPHWSLASLAC
jgi:hypothetical protein